MTTNWYDFLGEFGRELLSRLDGEDDFFRGTRNPVSDALREGDFVQRFQDLPGFNRMAVCRAAVLCQMQVFDRQGGPEGDRSRKALRRHWYSYFKSEVAQPLALQFGDYVVNSQGVQEIKDEDWASRLSMVYAELVDSGEVTYRELWVEDASRMALTNWEVLFQGLHLLICVEKDSLFADFKAAAQAIGAQALYSGKGKSSKAAIEKVLREAFSWYEDNPVFDDDPLVVLHISDYDYDGEAVIGPTFAEQARRYTRNIIEARIGVNPQQVREAGKTLQDAWYTIKVSNKGYQAWADEKAIFQARCSHCGAVYAVEGRLTFPCDCGEVIAPKDDATPHGFEVESLRTRDYYSLIADAFMRVVDFDYVITRLREECTADRYAAVERLVSQVCEENQSYQDLLKEFERLEAIKNEFESKVKEALNDVVEGHESDWEDEEDDPGPEDLRDHVQRYAGSSWGRVWRPFSRDVRTEKMVEWVLEDHTELMDELVDEEITW